MNGKVCALKNTGVKGRLGGRVRKTALMNAKFSSVRSNGLTFSPLDFSKFMQKTDELAMVQTVHNSW